MSAITVTVIVVGVTPTSVALSGVVLQTSEVVAVAVGAVVPVSPPPLPTFFPPPHAAATSTMTSRTPTQPKRLKVPPSCLRPADLMGRQIGKTEPAPRVACGASFLIIAPQPVRCRAPFGVGAPDQPEGGPE